MKITFLQQGIAMAIPALFALTAQGQSKPSKYWPTDHHYAKNNQYIRIDDDSSVNPVQTIVSYKSESNTYDFTMALGKVIEMYVDDRKLPADSFYLYNNVVSMIKGQIERDKKQAEYDRQQADNGRKLFELDRRRVTNDSKQAGDDAKKAGGDRVMMENILSDIVKEHIAADMKTVNNITLDENKFIVNGRQQPEAMFKKFKAKYIKEAGFSFYYIGDGDHQTFRYSGNTGSKQKFRQDAHR